MKKWIYLVGMIWFGPLVADVPFKTDTYSLSPAVEQRLGYNPHIRLIHESDPVVVHDVRRINLFVHDFNGSGNGAFILKRAGLLPGNVVTLDLPDKKGGLLKCSFGQMNEVLPVIAALKLMVIDRAHAIQAVDLYGLSRGGAVLINLLSVLAHPLQYANDLNSIAVTANDCRVILAKIMRGAHVLHCPLKSIRYAIPAMPSALLTCAVRIGTAYTRNGLDPMKQIHMLPNNLSILVHFQHRDQIVSNKADAEYIKILGEKSVHGTYVSVSNGGGHDHSGSLRSPEFKYTVHAYKKRHGSAYSRIYAQRSWDNLLPYTRMRKNPAAALSAIYTYYDQKEAIVTEQRPLRISPTWSDTGCLLTVKKRSLATSHAYYLNNERITCMACEKELDRVNYGVHANATQVLRQHVRTLLGQKHICHCI